MEEQMSAQNENAARPVGADSIANTPTKVHSQNLERSSFQKESHDSQTQTSPFESQIATWLTNANILIKHNEPSSARALVYKALSVNSRHSLALQMAADFLHPQRDFEQIRKILNVLCRVEYSFETVARKARCHYDVGDDKVALEFYYEAMSLVLDETPALFEVYRNVGNILTREGDYEGAEEYYCKAFTMKPDSDQIRVNLGTLAMQKQDLASALEHFRAAVAAHTGNEKAWVGLALVHQAMGDVALALGNLETAMDINPENRTAVHLFVSWTLQQGQIQKAMERLEDYLSRVDMDQDLSLVLVNLFCQTSRLDLAMLEVERLLLWNPKDEKLLKIESELKSQHGFSA